MSVSFPHWLVFFSSSLFCCSLPPIFPFIPSLFFPLTQSGTLGYLRADMSADANKWHASPLTASPSVCARVIEFHKCNQRGLLWGDLWARLVGASWRCITTVPIITQDPINKSGRTYYYRMTDAALLSDERWTQGATPPLTLNCKWKRKLWVLAAWSGWCGDKRRFSTFRSLVCF